MENRAGVSVISKGQIGRSAEIVLNRKFQVDERSGSGQRVYIKPRDDQVARIGDAG